LGGGDADDHLLEGAHGGEDLIGNMGPDTRSGDAGRTSGTVRSVTREVAGRSEV
jgi:hypothetical protein